MNEELNHVGAHFADRPAEPEHPMALEGSIVAGDAGLMLRCLVEELLQAGHDSKQIRKLMMDPCYQGLYAARRQVGAAAADALLSEAAARIGVHRVQFRELQALTPCLGGAPQTEKQVP